MPQVSDYLRVWRAMKTGNSFRDIEKITFTEEFIQTKRSDVTAVTRSAGRQLLEILQERVRQEKIDTLCLVYLWCYPQVQSRVALTPDSRWILVFSWCIYIYTCIYIYIYICQRLY